MTQQKHPRLDAFVSLVWYDTLLRFITNFIAKTSEILLAAGLVVSSANFLTDGAILGTTTSASQAWAWAQALAIDSSLAISFYHVLFCFKQRDWVKCVLYSLLTGLLALVAGTITNIDIFSHAIHAPLNHAMTIMGLNVEVLSSLRSIAVVGFVLMSRLRDVSLKDLTTTETDVHISQDKPIPSDLQIQASAPKEPDKNSPHFTIEEVTMLLQVLTRQDGATQTRITIEPDTTQTSASFGNGDPQHQLDLVKSQTKKNETPQRGPTQGHSNAPAPVDPARQAEPLLAPQIHEAMAPAPDPRNQIQAKPDPAPVGIDHRATIANREELLAQAYQELLAEGKKVSGRTLAQRAHMHRSFCTAWLKKHTGKPIINDRQHDFAGEMLEQSNDVEPAP